jgi:hypothetical protein
MQELPHGFPVVQCGFRFCRATASAGAHKFLAGIAAHPARLCVAVLHSLLLRSELGTRWNCQRANTAMASNISASASFPAANFRVGVDLKNSCAR